MFCVTNRKNEKSFVIVSLISYRAIYYSCKSIKIILLTWGVPRYYGRKIAKNCYVLYGIACLYGESRLTLTTSNKTCKSCQKLFSRGFINIIEIDPVGIINFKKLCRKKVSGSWIVWKKFLWWESLYLVRSWSNYAVNNQR